jgi:cation:H+ antiporter
MNPWLLLPVGITLLSVGAHLLVRGGSALAMRLGLSPLVVGLTVAAYGTSSPELVVSGGAAWAGSPALGIGNAIGSNLCNLGLILGLASLVRPLAASDSVIRREVPILLGCTVVAILFLLDGNVQRWEGAVLLSALLVYTFLTVRGTRRQAITAAPSPAAGEPVVPLTLARAITYTLVGLALLLVGSEVFVDAAVRLAEAWGWSEAVIGLTIVAIGTSLPELALTVAAVAKRQADLAIGNLVGSSIFNLLGILGVVGLLARTEAPAMAQNDLAVLFLLSAALLPFVRTSRRISRWEGLMLLGAFIAYTWWMVQAPSAPN